MNIYMYLFVLKHQVVTMMMMTIKPAAEPPTIAGSSVFLISESGSAEELDVDGKLTISNSEHFSL